MRRPQAKPPLESGPLVVVLTNEIRPMSERRSLFAPVYSQGGRPRFGALASTGRLTAAGHLNLLCGSLLPVAPVAREPEASVIACSPEGSVDIVKVLQKAKDKALRGGLMGMAAMFINVFALMWMRTTINFQYAKGMTMFGALKFLYADGKGELTGMRGTFAGIRRFYRGLGPALVQGPLSRFGDTAGNDGFMELANNVPQMKDLPTGVKTVGASASAACFRVVLMPVDALKTTLQVQGAQGLSVLSNKIATGGPFVLFHGAIGAMTATFVGHYPWFFTNNFLKENLPTYDRKENLPMYLGRYALIGFCSSAVSDTCSNSIRVLKTTVQTNEVPIGYMQAAQQVIAKDGMFGLFFRGLETKIFSNGMNGILFNILWSMGKDWYSAREKAAAAAAK